MYLHLYVCVCLCICMRVNVCVHVCVCMFGYIHKYICIHQRIPSHDLCVFVCVYVCVCLHTYLNTVCVYTYTFVCVYGYVCVCVCLRTARQHCVCVWSRAVGLGFPRHQVEQNKWHNTPSSSKIGWFNYWVTAITRGVFRERNTPGGLTNLRDQWFVVLCPSSRQAKFPEMTTSASFDVISGEN